VPPAGHRGWPGRDHHDWYSLTVNSKPDFAAGRGGTVAAYRAGSLRARARHHQYRFRRSATAVGFCRRRKPPINAFSDPAAVVNALRRLAPSTPDLAAPL